MMTNMVLFNESRKMRATLFLVYGEWYYKIIQRVHKRMGDDMRPDTGVSIEIIHVCLKHLDRWYREAEDPIVVKRVVDLGFFLSTGFSGSLRGEDVMKIDSYNLILYHEDAMNTGNSFVAIPLLGRFKGDTGIMYHIIPVAYEISSGIRNGEW